MQNLQSNQNIDIRHRCYKFSLSIIKLVSDLPNNRTSWIIADQLIRSSTSIGANLVEAKASSSRLEFKKFYEIALKSANETKYWLGLLRDSNILDANIANGSLKEVTEISNILAVSIMKLKKKNL